MRILAHRGFWMDESEKNTMKAISRAFDCGFGIETDLRDVCGKIVISHDCPKGNEILFEDVLKTLNSRDLVLALNIKADGLSKTIISLIEKYNVLDYFTFDMSIPEMFVQSKLDISYFTGISDLSPGAVLYKKSFGVWLDAFDSMWYESSQLNQLIEKIIVKDDKKICIVSEDLHKRSNSRQWELIRDSDFVNSDSLYLCTDKSMEAKEFFNV